MKKKILIIGGAGFIGHNLALKLKKLGGKVFIFDSLKVNNLENLRKNEYNLPYPVLARKIVLERLKLLKKNKIPVKILDARNYHKISRNYSKISPDIVIHLAAVSHANRSNKDPHSTFDHSLRTLENVLDNAKNKVKHFIFFSSSMVYGNFKKTTVDENDDCNPLGIYGALKFSAEKIIQAYGQTFDLPYTIIRPSALYGERCISRRVGQIFIESAINNKTIQIQGNGEEKLDFTYIQDLIDGVVKVINSKKSIKQVFNLTYGKSQSINKLLHILKQNFPKVKVNYVKRDKLMPVRGTLSTQKAKKLINYKSQWPLIKGYKNYIDWYVKFFKNK